ncbi:MAG: prepilin-type N-terminal cleavage/methylation domain-containing protein [Elusimicrobia bacterium]|nr:prepilin-type N-terminal cleavage/methylation domain-containing protein [Elusimicrobiota bacterium]
MRRDSGFTLIELLVVVLIVGILASLAIPQYFKTVEKARISESMSVISSIKSAQERYLAGAGGYASDLNNLDISYANLTTGAITTRYFNATMAVTGGSAFLLTLTRHTTASSVPGRYGIYSIIVNIPAAPVPAVSACAGGAGNCNELLK